MDLYLGSYGGPRGGAFSYERGTPVTLKYRHPREESSFRSSKRPGPDAGRGFGYRGTSLIRNTPPSDPTVALCIGTSGDPRGVGVLYERGVPVQIFKAAEVFPGRSGAGVTGVPRS